MENEQPKQLRDFYEKVYKRDVSIAHIPSDDDFMYSQVLSQIRPYLHSDLKVLDLGCNTGVLSLYMAKHGCDVLGIDLARNAVEAAQHSADYYKMENVTFQSIDFLLDWDKEEYFDFVLCSHVVEHVPDDDLFLKKIYCSLRPGGRLILLTPADYSSLGLVSKFFTGRFAHDEAVGHIRRYDKKTIVSKSENAGFSVDKTVFLDGFLREWFLICEKLRPFNRIWSLPYVRRVFNFIDLFTAKFVFPSAICVHLKK